LIDYKSCHVHVSWAAFIIAGGALAASKISSSSPWQGFSNKVTRVDRNKSEMKIRGFRLIKHRIVNAWVTINEERNGKFEIGLLFWALSTPKEVNSNAYID